MKIRKLGLIQPWNLDVTCLACKCMITLEGPHDLGVIEFGHNKPNSYYYVCPVCGCVNNINSTEIREDIKRWLPWV